MKNENAKCFVIFAPLILACGLLGTLLDDDFTDLMIGISAALQLVAAAFIIDALEGKK